MDYRQKIKALMQQEHMTAKELSYRIGKNEKYVSNLLSRNTDMNTTLALSIFNALGYEVELVKVEKRIRL